MAQGKMKKKGSVPQVKKKQQQRGVKKQPKKNHACQYIAPKKAKLVASEKLKKNLVKAIKTNIESEVSSKALLFEPKKFHFVKLSQQTAGRLEKNRSKKAK